MKRLSAFIIAFMAIGLTLGLAGTASAASIGCGQCHGTAAISSNTAEQATGHRTGFETTPGYEDQKTPVDPDNCGKGRGLHGIHMNYSSASYGGNGTNTILGVTYIRHGNCNYCHNKHPHENGFVEFSGMIPTARQKASVSSVKVSGTGIGVNGGDLTQMDGTATCTTACHKGTSATNPAPWGNYTSPSVKLTCNSCHDDLSSPSGLSGAHSAHLANSATVPSGTAMNASANAGCVNCHTNNTGEGKTANDFGSKAYPHAADGTNVVADNATLTGSISSATKAGLNTTCAAACHPRSNELTPAITWGGSMNCNMCHYYPGTGNTDTGSGALPGAHEIHITNASITCDRCHPIPSTTAHATVMPPSATGVTFASDVNYNGGATLTGTCTNSCHTTGSGSWVSTSAVNGCAACHSYPNAAATMATGGKGDWLNYTSIARGSIKYNGHLIRASVLQNATTAVSRQSLKHLNKVTGYDYQNDTYASVTGDNNKCGVCHKGATHRNGTIDVADSNNNGTICNTTFTFNAATTISTPSATHSNATCDNTKCHFGRRTPNWN